MVSSPDDRIATVCCLNRQGVARAAFGNCRGHGISFRRVGSVASGAARCL